MIFKVMPALEWQEACATGTYRGSADDLRDGFIHFSAAHQLRGTLEKYYTGQNNLVVIAVSEDDLGSALQWEPSRGGDLFPHLYASLETQTAQWFEPLDLGPDDVPAIPKRITTC